VGTNLIQLFRVPEKLSQQIVGTDFIEPAADILKIFAKNLIPKNAPLIYSGDGNRPSFSGKTRLFTECLQIADKEKSE
jgi:hypothetical protein